MNLEQYEVACRELFSPEKYVVPERLNDLSDRTLVYGYSLERDTHHVYLKDGEIHVHMYNSSVGTLIHTSTETTSIKASFCRPSKRAYPERCDFEFANLMKSLGCPLTFTTFDDSTYELTRKNEFHGKVYTS